MRNLLYHQPQVSVIPEAHHGSTWVADRTVDFLRHHARYYAPGGGDGEAVLLLVLVDRAAPALERPGAVRLDVPAGGGRPAVRLGPGAGDAALPACASNKASADLEFASPDHLRRIKALYYGNVSLIDKGIGRILEALDTLGLAENTLVVFSSDHGEMMGDHGLMQKSKPYDASARIPFLLRFPGRVQPGRRSAERVSLTDLLPTFLDAAGVAYPAELGLPPLPGASLLGRPGGGLAGARDDFVIAEGAGPRRWWSIVQGPWKYNYYAQGGWEELFHLEDDPREARNLLLDGAPVTPAARRQGDALRAQIVEWERAHGFSSSFDGRWPPAAGAGRGEGTPVWSPTASSPPGWRTSPRTSGHRWRAGAIRCSTRYARSRRSTCATSTWPPSSAPGGRWKGPRTSALLDAL